MTTPSPDSRGANRGLVVVAVILAVAIIAVLGATIVIVRSRDSGSTTATSAGVTTVAPPATNGSSTTTALSSSTTTSARPSITSSTSTAPTSIAPDGGLGEVCISDRAGVFVRYPTGWYTTTEPGLACSMFDPEPIVVIPQSEMPYVAVSVTAQDLDLAAAVAQEKTPEFVTVDREEPLTLGGRSAVCLTLTSTGEGLLEKGARYYDCFVAIAGRTVLVSSIRPPGAPDLGYDSVVRDMAASLDVQ